VKELSFLRARAWILVAGVAVLIAVHIGLFYALSRTALAAAAVSAAVILIVVKHFGLLGSLHGRVRHRSRQSKADTIKED
jgi:hypothetical protein